MFLLPIAHEDLTVRRLPWVTLAIFAICLGMQIWSDNHNQRLLQQDEVDWSTQHSVARLGYRPAIDGFTPTGIKHIFTSIFAHGGWVHLIGNMFMLYLLGTNIEDRWGRWRFLVFYLAGGVIAALTYGFLHEEDTMPLVGASGAIAAAMGAFSVLYFSTRIRFFYALIFPPRAGTFRAPAWLMLLLWFAEQVISTDAEAMGKGGVAYSAHAGGFAFGVIIALVAQITGWDKRASDEVDAATGAWKEDPDFLAAQRAAEEGNDARAGSLVTAVLSRRPQHGGAHLLAYTLYAKKQSLNAMLRHADAAFIEWLRVEPKAALTAFVKLDGLLDDRRLESRTLLAVLGAAKGLRDLDAASRVLARVGETPNHALLGRAYFVCGEIAEAENREMEAELYFNELIRRCPQDSFAPMAQRRLQTQ